MHGMLSRHVSPFRSRAALSLEECENTPSVFNRLISLCCHLEIESEAEVVRKPKGQTAKVWTTNMCLLHE